MTLLIRTLPAHAPNHHRPFKIERELGRGGTSTFDVVHLSFSHHGNRVLAVMPVSSGRDRSISIIQNWPYVVAP